MLKMVMIMRLFGLHVNNLLNPGKRPEGNASQSKLKQSKERKTRAY
jgi:hypothetical protein